MEISQESGPVEIVDFPVILCMVIFQKMTMNIVDFPINSMVIFQKAMYWYDTFTGGYFFLG